jgi:serine/threonine protein kinase
VAPAVALHHRGNCGGHLHGHRQGRRESIFGKARALCLVAVKLLKAGIDSAQVLGRFEAERQALALMEHAQQKGIIHRDRKRSNILVALHDGKAVPEVIDTMGRVPRMTGHKTGTLRGGRTNQQHESKGVS